MISADFGYKCSTLISPASPAHHYNASASTLGYSEFSYLLGWVAAFVESMWKLQEVAQGGEPQPADLFGQSQKLRDALPKTHAKMHGAFSTLRLHTPVSTDVPSV